MSSNKFCKACVLLEGLNKGLPMLSIGKRERSLKMDAGDGGESGPPKRFAPAVAAVAAVVKRLTDCSSSELVQVSDELMDWSLPRSDFFHWIPVLDRFDSILEAALKTCDFTIYQKGVFDAETKSTVMAVLKISRVLWDNCANRSLYNSYEHLLSLLHTSDLDILDATLRLLLRLVQRMYRQKTMKSLLAPALEAATVLAQALGTREAGMDIDQLVVSFTEEPDRMSTETTEVSGLEGSKKTEWHSLLYHFYRTKAAKSKGNSDGSANLTGESQEGQAASSSGTAETESEEPPLEQGVLPPLATPSKSSKVTPFSTPVSGTPGDRLGISTPAPPSWGLDKVPEGLT
ncbi:hypothetical protein HDU67_004019, partial [Dinochytrium kinnereticum]